MVKILLASNTVIVSFLPLYTTGLEVLFHEYLGCAQYSGQSIYSPIFISIYTFIYIVALMKTQLTFIYNYLLYLHLLGRRHKGPCFSTVQLHKEHFFFLKTCELRIKLTPRTTSFVSCIKSGFELLHLIHLEKALRWLRFEISSNQYYGGEKG